MPFDAVAKEFMLDAAAGQIEVAALHSADPGAGAANENSDARQAVAFAAAGGDEVTLSADVAFTGPASAAVTWFTVWRNTGGTVRWGKGQIVSGDVAYNAEGDYVLKAGTRMRIVDPT